ncbi:MAG: hypothetical protein ACEY3D_05245 [Rickettsia sp.]|uniref:hypothetical protein n=1 Tax=Rickettsia sp. TaxID=789 RepID=UPI00397B1CBD
MNLFNHTGGIMFKQDPETTRQIANKQATDEIEARERRKKYDKSPEQIVTEREKHRQLQEKEGYEIC